MEFFFPSDVFAFEQPRTRPSTHCGFDVSPLFARSLIDAIQQEEALQREHARAQALQRQQAARRAQEERQARAYLEHLYHLQRQEELARRREAQRQYQLQQLHRQEQIRKQQYAEYQRRKAHAIEQERRRVNAFRHAQDQSRNIFLALEDLLFGAFEQQQQPEAKTTEAPVDVKGKGKEVEIQQSAQAEDEMNVDADPEEVGPAPSTPVAPVEAAPAPVQPTNQEPEKAKQDVLVFTHPFPAGEYSADISADSIQISVDEQTNKVTVSGLWDLSTPQRPASPASSTASRGCSRSPKRARVSDVDENGNEIVKDDDESESTLGDDFVKLHFAPAKVQKTFDLPEGAKTEGLRAELTEEGLKLWVSA